MTLAQAPAFAIFSAAPRFRDAVVAMLVVIMTLVGGIQGASLDRALDAGSAQIEQIFSGHHDKGHTPFEKGLGVACSGHCAAHTTVALPMSPDVVQHPRPTSLAWPIVASVSPEAAQPPPLERPPRV